MEIRRIRPDEGLQFWAIRLRSLADSPAAFSSTLAETESRPEAHWHDRALQAAAGSQQTTYVAVEDDLWYGLLGAMFDREPPGTVVLYSMWVDPAKRGHGTGRALIETAAEWARSHGATRLELSVTGRNDAAIALYTSTGFVRTDQTQPLPSVPSLGELLMERLL
ncbi:MAG: GNAT family N-acetyltransferase [Dehalococcoidia bacterium]